MTKSVDTSNKRYTWHYFAAIGVVIFSLLLHLLYLAKEGYSNQYYSAAVKSMLTSFKNFFFVSFDSGGFISVDKPPLGLWLEAISCKIFGLSSFGLILPQALCSAASVFLIYKMVSKAWNRTGGIFAALITALTPALAAVSRTNNLDSILLFFMILSAYFVLSAIRTQKFSRFLFSMISLGLAFNVKMLQAYLILPALLLIFWLGFKVSKTKLAGLTLVSLLVLASVSFSWMAAVQLTPAANRPYVGGSTNNSVFELMTGHNGMTRLLGRTQGSMGPDGNPGDDTRSFNPGQPPQEGGMQPPQGEQPPQGDGMQSQGMQGGPQGKAGAGGMDVGTAGVFRLFDSQLGTQAGWLLFPGILGILLAAYAFIKRLMKKRGKNEFPDERYFSQIFWAAWLFPMMIFFSVAGFFHQYYLCMFAPALGALTVSIVFWLNNKMRSHKIWNYIFAVLYAVTMLIQVVYVSQSTWSFPLTVILIAETLIGLTLGIIYLIKKKNNIKVLTALIMAISVLTAPAVWCATTVMYNLNTTIPVAGPDLAGQGKMSGNPSLPENTGNQNSGLVSYLLKNYNNEKYLAAVSDSNTAAPIILSTGKAVMAVGGFEGTDQTLTVDKLKEMIKNNEIRYFIVGNQRGDNTVNQWVAENGNLINSSEYNENTSSNTSDSRSFGRMGNQMGGQLYDLKGSSY